MTRHIRNVPVIAGTAPTSVILDAARRLEKLWQETDLADLVSRESDDPDVKRETDRYGQVLYDLRQAEMDLIAATRATTPAEAAVQIMIAAGYSETYLGSGLSDEFARDLDAKMQRLLFSAIGVCAAGLDLTEFGARRCGIPNGDPWRVPPCVEAARARLAEAAE